MKFNNETAVPKKKLKLKKNVKYFGFFVMGILVAILFTNIFNNKNKDEETNSCYVEQTIYYFEMKGN